MCGFQLNRCLLREGTKVRFLDFTLIQKYFAYLLFAFFLLKCVFCDKGEFSWMVTKALFLSQHKNAPLYGYHSQPHCNIVYL